MDLVRFLFQVNICLLVFYSFYRLLLYKETFFVWNRIYLISTVCLSFVIPMLHFEWLNSNPVSREVHLKIGDVFLTGTAVPNVDFDWLQLAGIIYFLGVLLTLIFFIYKLWSLSIRLAAPEKGNAFSFFNFKRIDTSLDNFGTIDRHEEIHVRQFHSFDVLLMELASVIVWFNPVIYWYKLNIKYVHEYLADEAAAEFEGSKKNYALLLLSKAIGAMPDLSNSFVRQSEVKKRILMLQRLRSDKKVLWRYLGLIPLFAILILLSSGIKAGNGIDFVQTGVQELTDDTYGASFPGGIDKFVAYLKAETKYPESERKKGIEGKVMVSFIVDQEGALTEVKIEEGISPALDQEALRLMRNSKKWIPGKVNGVPVKIKYDMGVNFILKK